MRALELEVLVHPFRPSVPSTPSFSLTPSSGVASGASASGVTASSTTASSTPVSLSTPAHVYGWRGEGRLGEEMGPVTLLSEVFVLNLKR